MKITLKMLTAALLCAAMILSLCACGGKKEEEVVITDALELLNTVWSSYADSDKFPAAGGDYSEENMKTDEPGRFGVEDKEALEYLLCVPESGAALIDDAATLTHMMNTNTFTAGALHCTDGADTAKLAELIKTELENRHWMCGFPDKFVIYSVGSYVVSVYGKNEPISTFMEKLTEAYPTAELLYEQAIQ